MSSDNFILYSYVAYESSTEQCDLGKKTYFPRHKSKRNAYINKIEKSNIENINMDSFNKVFYKELYFLQCCYS